MGCVYHPGAALAWQWQQGGVSSRGWRRARGGGGVVKRQHRAHRAGNAFDGHLAYLPTHLAH